MKAMILSALTNLAANPAPLQRIEVPIPRPGPGEVLLRVLACAVCHTELDEIEGRTPPPTLPVIPGHQVVARVQELGTGVSLLQPGQRVGVGWIYSACGDCDVCRRGEENLCPEFVATGRDVNGGYAEYLLAPERFVFPIPPSFSAVEAAPLLCAGAVGYRALRLAGLQDGQHLGLTGFGASGHQVLQMARYLYPHSRIFVFARSAAERELALSLGAAWVGASGERCPRRLQAIIDTTPVWQTVVDALGYLAPGGRLVINAIRKEAGDQQALLGLDYASHLWMEKEIKSVANVARRDLVEFLDLAGRIPIRPQVQVYSLEQANQALLELKQGAIRGAKVLEINSSGEEK